MTIDFTQLAADIKAWGKEVGFQQVGIAPLDLSTATEHLKAWLANKMHGEMEYLARNLDLRAHPDHLVPNTIRIISVRMNYLPADTKLINTLRDKTRGYISRYALGRDYHKLMRKRLTKLAKKIADVVGEFGYRAFADSAPIMEKPLAERAGLGWMGKNTLILNRQAGSWFFLGELFTDLPLPIDHPVQSHCGKCQACLDICPTKAIVAPYHLDARRCISYLTIENKGPIPEPLRPLIGNRIFGCDDCQLVCPWNKFAKHTDEKDFSPRHGLDTPRLIDLFLWTESQFEQNTQGSAIRRTGYKGWLRNIAVALGNAPHSPEIIAALRYRENDPDPLIREHVAWALKFNVL